MGLLDKLFSKEVKDKLDELTKKAEEAIGDALDKVLPDEKKAEETAAQTVQTAQAVQQAAEETVP